MESSIRQGKGRRTRRRTIHAATAALITGALLSGPGFAGPAQARGPGRLPSTSCGTTTLYKADGSKWACSFGDDFNGFSLDLSKWVVSTTALYGFPLGASCLTSDTVTVSGGELRLAAKDTGAPFACSGPYGTTTTQYTGAHIGTVGTFAQTYGRFEIRAKSARSGSGFHSNFWMSPANPVYGGWPNSGEIDVSETWSVLPNRSVSAVRYAGETASDSSWICTVPDASTWHTYTVIWQPTVMTFLIDGQTCLVDHWSPLAPLTGSQPFDQPFNILLSNFVENSTDNPVDSTTAFPSTYEVDYVRAWR